MIGRLLSSSRSLLLAGVGVSSALHLLLFGALVIDAVWPYLYLTKQLSRRPKFAIALEAQVLDRRDAVDNQRLELPPVQHAEPIVIDATPAATVNITTDGTGDAAIEERVAQRIQVAADRAEKRTDDENLKQLEQLSGQLDRLSSQKSVDEMADALGQWLGTLRRATQPAAEATKGDFDFATAQLHDVRRRRDDQDRWAYSAVLVDSAGRTRQSAMQPEEGASAYKTMQLIKSSPLAEMVYRRIAMSLLDEIIKAAQQAEQMAEPATTTEQPVDTLP